VDVSSIANYLLLSDSRALYKVYKAPFWMASRVFIGELEPII